MVQPLNRLTIGSLRTFWPHPTLPLMDRLLSSSISLSLAWWSLLCAQHLSASFLSKTPSKRFAIESSLPRRTSSTLSWSAGAPVSYPAPSRVSRFPSSSLAPQLTQLSDSYSLSCTILKWKGRHQDTPTWRSFATLSLCLSASPQLSNSSRSSEDWSTD